MAKNKPAHRVAIGNIEAAIWKNERDNGNSWFSVSFSRKYRDQDGLKSTSSFRLEDLLVVAKASHLAFAWILRKTQAKAENGWTTDE